MWRWRDWVIDAFNRNLPFDRFTVEQLAGDLLPERRRSTSGSPPASTATTAATPRAASSPRSTPSSTSSTASRRRRPSGSGLTLGCARCHDHKYDPITQKEFYQLFAFFNNVPEKGRAIKYGNSPPVHQGADAASSRRSSPTSTRELAAAERRFADDRAGARRRRRPRGRSRSHRRRRSTGRPTRGLQAHYRLDGDAKDATGGRARVPRRRARLRPGPDRQGRRTSTASGSSTRATSATSASSTSSRSAAWVRPERTSGGTIVSRMTDAAERRRLQPRAGRTARSRSTSSSAGSTTRIRVETERAARARTLAPRRSSPTTARAWPSGVKLYVDGQPRSSTVLLDELNQIVPDEGAAAHRRRRRAGGPLPRG